MTSVCGNLSIIRYFDAKNIAQYNRSDNLYLRNHVCRSLVRRTKNSDLGDDFTYVSDNVHGSSYENPTQKPGIYMELLQLMTLLRENSKLMTQLRQLSLKTTFCPNHLYVKKRFPSYPHKSKLQTLVSSPLAIHEYI